MGLHARPNEDSRYWGMGAIGACRNSSTDNRSLTPIVQCLAVFVSLDATGPLAPGDHDDGGVMVVFRGA